MKSTNRQKNNEILKLTDEESAMAFLKQSSISTTEFFTGILSSGQKDLKLSAGKILQSVFKGTLLTQLGRETKKYIKDGRIKEDYLATHKNRATLCELLKFLDEEIPDDELFRAIKSIFFTSISSGASPQDEILAYEFLCTAKKMSGTEILILRANYEIVHGKISPELNNRNLKENPSSRSTWKRLVACQMGYKSMFSIVDKYEQNLELLGLISPRYEMDRLQGDFEPTQNHRLTDFGIKFCEFITNFDA